MVVPRMQIERSFVAGHRHDSHVTKKTPKKNVLTTPYLLVGVLDNRLAVDRHNLVGDDEPGCGGLRANLGDDLVPVGGVTDPDSEA